MCEQVMIDGIISIQHGVGDCKFKNSAAVIQICLEGIMNSVLPSV